MRIAIVVFLSMSSAPALAQAAPLDNLYACTGIADGVKRLACFDAAVAGLRQAEATGGVSVVGPAQTEQAAKEAFGLAAPSSPPDRELDSVSLPVKSVVRGADGRHVFTLDNGQVWRQTDNTRLPSIGKGPWQAEIRRAALGGFMLKLDSRTSVRARRVE